MAGLNLALFSIAHKEPHQILLEMYSNKHVMKKIVLEFILHYILFSLDPALLRLDDKVWITCRDDENSLISYKTKEKEKLRRSSADRKVCTLFYVIF